MNMDEKITQKFTAEEVRETSRLMRDHAPNEYAIELDCSRMLEAYAATLRQQATNSPEIGSKLVGCVTELAGYVDPEQVADMQKNGGGVSIGSFSERYGRTHPVYYLRAPSQQAERGDGAVSDEVVEIACKAASEVSADGIEAVAWPDEYDADELSTGRLFMRTALEAVAPLLRAPAEQGGRVDAETVQEIVDRYIGKTNSVARYIADDLQAALAQNAQGEAVGSEPCATVADAVRIADKCRSPDDEGVVWVPESCYLTMVGEIERLETLLYTDGNANIPLHAERAGVPEGMVLVPREPTPEMRAAHSIHGDTSDWWNAVISAAPSQPEDAA